MDPDTEPKDLVSRRGVDPDMHGSQDLVSRRDVYPDMDPKDHLPRGFSAMAHSMMSP